MKRDTGNARGLVRALAEDQEIRWAERYASEELEVYRRDEEGTRFKQYARFIAAISRRAMAAEKGATDDG